MKHLIRTLANEIAKSENDATRYTELVKTDGWQMHVLHLRRLQLLMSVDMMDASFTKLSPEEKDVQQRVYAGINELINFLINPLKELERKSKLKAVENQIKRNTSAFKPHTGATFGAQPERT